jgi:hypothetical protein
MINLQYVYFRGLVILKGEIIVRNQKRKLLSFVMSVLMIFSIISGTLKPLEVKAATIGAGTLASPYNVEGAIAAVQPTTPVATTPAVSVEGYIVGFYATNTTDPRGIILADSPTTKSTGNESDKPNVVYVIPNAATSQNVGVLSSWNTEDKLGRFVKVTGNWRASVGALYSGAASTIGTIKDKDIIIVPSGPAVPVTAISIPNNVSVYQGSNVKVNTTYAPVDTTEIDVNWTSSMSNIATVTKDTKISHDGIVKGIIPGTTVLTATSAVNPALTAECTVTVKAHEPLVKMDVARTQPVGNYVKVTGIVTFIDATKKVAYIQDDTAAIAVDYAGYSSAPTMAIGDQLTAMGQLASSNQLLTVKPVPLVGMVKETKTLTNPTPKVITIAEANSEAYESQVVKILGATIGTINIKANTTLENLLGAINIYKMPDGTKSPNVTGIVEGDFVDTTAVVSQFSSTTADTGYQLRISDDTTKEADGVTLKNLTKVLKNTTADTVAPSITHTPVTCGSAYSNLNITATAKDDRKMSGVKIYFREVGQAEYTSDDMPDDPTSYVYTIFKEKLSAKGLEYYLEAKDAAGNITTSPADNSKPYLVNISDEDTVSPSVINLTPQADSNIGDNLRPLISAEFIDVSGINPLSVKLYLDDKQVSEPVIGSISRIEYLPTSDLTKGPHTAKLEVSDNKNNLTTKIWNFTIGDELFNHYYGQIHAHTNISDGQGSLDDAYTWARDNGKADFFAVTDHSNSLENDTQCNIKDGTKSPEWVNAQATSDKYNTKDFVALYGYEMTWSGSTGGWGHINTFNTPGFETRSNTSMDLKKYYETLPTVPESISQLNHPGKTFGDFADFGYYTEAADKVVNMIEVGNGEGPVRSSGYFPSYEYYTRALDRGWHVAPTNNQDNHKGNWMTANDARTVILAPELTRDSMYQAMREKKVYATEDKNLKLMFKVNGKVMGSSLDNPNSLNVSITVNDPDATDKIGKVSIIANGGVVVDSKSFNTNNATWNLSLNPDFSYYYVRVDQEDQDIAVSSPVWTGSVSPVGISNVTASQVLGITNEPIDIAAELYNNGTVSLMNSKVEFFKNEINDANKIGQYIIPRIAGSSKGTAKISWSPDKVGNTTIYARTSLSTGESTRVFTESTKLKVMNREDVVKVVIDGGHYNQYVTGYNAGKYTAFQQMIADARGTLIVNKDAITDADLKDAKVLVLTDPESTASTGVIPSVYTTEELAAIKKFVDAGGNLIITSAADYKDATGEHQNSEQGNKILEGIGSNLRFNDDEVVDKTNNAGQTFRLFFDDYNYTSKYELTKDVPKEQLYSFYSGCSVIPEKGADETNIDYLLKGHDTTETLDSDLKNDAITVDKGNVNAIAAEMLPSGAKIVVAGSTFFSDFEVMGENLYSNTKITKNILNWTAAAPQPPTVSIKDFRADADGNNVPDNLGKRLTVEGIVTAQSGSVLPSNAFFDCMYIQDGTAGITVFGVSQTSVKVGQRVRISGYVDAYQGDSEIQIADETKDLQILEDTIQIVAPTTMTTADSMLEKNEGTLINIKGIVTKMDSQNIYVDDNLEDAIPAARAYVEGYIWDGIDENNKGKWNPQIKVGETVSIIGLGSEDPEGHRLRVRNTAEIVLLDVAAPVITITGVEDKKLYNTDVQPVITTDDLEATVTVTLNDKAYDNSAITAAGTYTLKVTAIDKAGNKSEKIVGFTIDKTLPVITVTGVQNNKIYNTTVQPVITVSDLSAVVTTKTLNGKVYGNSPITAEGVYTLKVIAVDKAGNGSEKTVRFTIDKTAPVITVTGVENNKIYNTDVKSVISVNDPNAVVNVTLNSRPYSKGTITAPGIYTIKVTAVDKAGNKSEKIVTYTIDKTAPVIKVIGVENNKTYKTAVKPVITTNDSNAVVTMTLNGKAYNKSSITTNGTYTLKIKAVDKAGNKSEKIIIFKIKK